MQQQKEKVSLLQETLESFPDGFYVWTYNSIGFICQTFCSRRLAVLMNLSQGKSASFDSLLERFSLESANAIVEALAKMRLDLSPFALEVVNLLETRSFIVSGFRTQTQENQNYIDIVWVQETTDTTRMCSSFQEKTESLESENVLFKKAFDAFPFPIWFRNEELLISYCNQAYAQAVQASTPQEAVLRSSELVYEKSPREAKVLAATARATGKERSAKELVVFAGERRWIETFEIPLLSSHILKNQTVGFVRDISHEKELQNSLQMHISSHNGVLEHLKTAIAVFDAEMQLQFYNIAFMKLWDLEEEWLDSSPSYARFLDLLREKRRLPENRDFTAYKVQELKYFTSLVSATEDILHLPSGIALRRMMTPYPLGGLLITYEDVTGTLTMERSVSVLNATQMEVLNHLREGILLFGRNGRLRLANQAYRRLWQVEETAFESEELSVSETLETLKAFFENQEAWEELKKQVLSVISVHTGESFQILRPDEKVIEFSAVGLPDGGFFVSFLDVTQEEELSQMLKEKKER